MFEPQGDTREGAHPRCLEEHVTLSPAQPNVSEQHICQSGYAGLAGCCHIIRTTSFNRVETDSPNACRQCRQWRCIEATVSGAIISLRMLQAICGQLGWINPTWRWLIRHQYDNNYIWWWKWMSRKDRNRVSLLSVLRNDVALSKCQMRMFTFYLVYLIYPIMQNIP